MNRAATDHNSSTPPQHGAAQCSTQPAQQHRHRVMHSVPRLSSHPHTYTHSTPTRTLPHANTPAAPHTRTHKQQRCVHAPSASSMYAMSGLTCCSVAIGCRCRRRLHTTPTKCSECMGTSTARCRRRRMRGSASARWSKCSAVCGRWYSSSNTARSGRMRTAAGGFGGRNAGRSTCVNWCLQAAGGAGDSRSGRSNAEGRGEAAARQRFGARQRLGEVNCASRAANTELFDRSNQLGQGRKLEATNQGRKRRWAQAVPGKSLSSGEC